MSSVSLVRICESASYYLMGTGSFRNVKWPERGADNVPPSSVAAANVLELYGLLPSATAQVCYGVTFTFACYHNQEDYDLSFHEYGNVNSQRQLAVLTLTSLIRTRLYDHSSH